jgi:hypothetical protein
MGYGTGVFTTLKLTHLMPASRVQEDYLLRLVEGHARSTLLLMAIRNPAFVQPRRRWLDHIREFRLRRGLDPIARRIHDARRRGEARALAQLAGTNLPPHA